MRTTLLVMWMTLGVASIMEAQCPPSRAERVEYRNGLWYDGTGFQRRTMYVTGAQLSTRRANGSYSVVDLEGGYVIPPFAEAHNHNIFSIGQLDTAVATYLRDGVFYSATLSTLPRLTQGIRHLVNCATSVDVIFANGGITASRGHPIALRERLLRDSVYPGFTVETLRDHAYYIVDSVSQIEPKVRIVLADKPDIVKIILVHSEEYDLRRDDDKYFGQKGLNPALVPGIVERIKRDGLRVFAHVNSAFDFRVATEAGVDVIAHLPGSRVPDLIDSASAALAARKGIAVITTAVLARRVTDSVAYRRVRDAQRANLGLLRKAGVNVVIGSDIYDDTSVGEVEYLRSLNLYSNAELLRMWSVRTPQLIFPSRKLGKLDDGYEASFLVLEGNPLADWAATRRIKLRVKQGATLK